MKNITYINAGAGSGKTYRLTEQLYNHIINGDCTPSQTLLTTFTEAAAADFKRRVQEKFIKNNRYDLASQLNSATIGTTHSICLKYIKKYWYKLGISANISVMDESAKNEYINTTLYGIASDEDIKVFHNYAYNFNIKDFGKYNYDFWKSALGNLVEKSEAFSINNLTYSHEQSLELAKQMFGADGRLGFVKDPKLNETDLRNLLYDVINRVFRIASEWRKQYTSYKREHALIEYNDMENLFLELLKDTEVQQEIHDSIRYVFVDEFQDSNPKQLQIFDRLSDLVAHSYWVGDPKQSIYGFRGCDTELVNAVIERVTKKNKDGLAYKVLKTSYRSVPSLVELANQVFVPMFDGVLPEGMVRLEPHRKVTPSHPIQHWDLKPSTNPETNRSSASKDQLFDAISAQIKAMLDGEGEIKQVYDDQDNLHNIRPSDIAILMRTNSDCDSLTSWLTKRGVSVNTDVAASPDNNEVALVKLLLNYMISESESLLRRELAGLLYDRTANEMLSLNDDELDSLLAPLHTLRKELQGLPVDELVKTLILRLDIMEICAKWGDADRRRKSLMAMIIDAKGFAESRTQAGQAAAIDDYIAHLNNSGCSPFPSTGDGVTVTTYHRSKGLQWPVVILCSLDNERNAVKSFAQGTNIERETAPTPENPYPQYYITYIPSFLVGNTNVPTDIAADIKGMPKYTEFDYQENQELRRVLYVGMTRARDYVITTSQNGKKLKWLENVGITCGLQKDANDDDTQTIWGESANPSVVRRIACANIIPAEQPQEYRYGNITLQPDPRQPLTLTPSSLDDDDLVRHTHIILRHTTTDRVGHAITIRNANESNYATIGTCLHNFFAVFRSEQNDAENTARASHIINAWHLTDKIPNPSETVSIMRQLYAFLTQTFGAAVRIEREFPYTRRIGGQIINGEIDLAWFTSDKDCLLIDYKNYFGILNDVLAPPYSGDTCHKHSAAFYAPQLTEYRTALSSQYNVTHTLICYTVLGAIVELEKD